MSSNSFGFQQPTIIWSKVKNDRNEEKNEQMSYDVFFQLISAVSVVCSLYFLWSTMMENNFVLNKQSILLSPSIDEAKLETY